MEPALDCVEYRLTHGLWPSLGSAIVSMFCFSAHFTFRVGCRCAVLLFCFVGWVEEHVEDHINVAHVAIYVSFSWMYLIFLFTNHRLYV